jgi:hypothetical protein
VRSRRALTITEGHLIVIGAETFKIIGEPKGDALGLVLACEAATILNLSINQKSGERFSQR